MAKDDLRVRRIKQYVLARLREELANAPRGAQAKLAKRLGVSGAHLSNMLSSTGSREPGEQFRRKVAAHWGASYAELEALALGEEAPRLSVPPASEAASSTTRHVVRSESNMPSNLSTIVAEYSWMDELPDDLRMIVREQARQHYAYTREDLPLDEWQRIVTGLEREALALVAHRQSPRKRAR